MKKSAKTWFSSVVFSLIIVTALLSAGCAAAPPQNLEIPVKLTSGRLDPGTIQVGQNDTVTLKIVSDQPGALHLHGYDLEHEVELGAVTDFVFVADASGRFRIAFHAAGVDPASHDDPGHPEESAGLGHSHQETGEVEEIDVGFLEVQPR